MLLSVKMPAPWDRVVELSFGVRPGEEYTHRLLLEVRVPKLLFICHQCGAALHHPRTICVFAHMCTWRATKFAYIVRSSKVQGNYSNLVLVDHTTILACGYQVRRKDAGHELLAHRRNLLEMKLSLSMMTV